MVMTTGLPPPKLYADTLTQAPLDVVYSSPESDITRRNAKARQVMRRAFYVCVHWSVVPRYVLDNAQMEHVYVFDLICAPSQPACTILISVVGMGSRFADRMLEPDTPRNPPRF